MTNVNRSHLSTIQSPIASTDIEKLLNQAPAGQNVASMLEAHGLNAEIKDVKLSLNLANHLDFSGCRFDHVEVSGNLNGAQFRQVQFDHVKFDQVNLNQATFDNSRFEQSQFVKAELTQVSFIDSSMQKTTLEGCNLSDSSFYKTGLADTIFSNPNFHNVLDLDNQLNEVHVVGKQAQAQNDYAMTQSEYHAAVAQIASNGGGYWAMNAHHDLQNAGVKIMSMDASELRTFAATVQNTHFDRQALIAEIKHEIAKADKDSDLSIVKQVLQADSPQIQLVKDFVAHQASEMDAVFVPGGEDVVADFYGKSDIFANESYFFNQFLEFAMVDHAVSAQKPLLGICRGLQMINVFFGGTIKNVDGHFGITPSLDVHLDKGVLGEIAKPGMKGPSYHHQAIDKLGDGLEVVASYQGVIKGVQSKDGLPLMMTQFHPEYRTDEVSNEIMRKYVDMSADNAVNRYVLELKDVLHVEQDILPSAAPEAPLSPGHDLPELPAWGYVDFGSHLPELAPAA